MLKITHSFVLYVNWSMICFHTLSDFALSLSVHMPHHFLDLSRTIGKNVKRPANVLKMSSGKPGKIRDFLCRRP